MPRRSITPSPFQGEGRGEGGNAVAAVPAAPPPSPCRDQLLRLLPQFVGEARRATGVEVELHARPQVKRGRMVNRLRGEPSEQLRERHDADDFDTRTQDKIEAAAAD